MSSRQKQRAPYVVYRRSWGCGCVYVGQTRFTPEKRDSAPYDSANPAVVAHGKADGYEVIAGAGTEEEALRKEAREIAAAAAASPGGWGCAPGRLLNIAGNVRAWFAKRPKRRIPVSQVRPGLVLEGKQAVVCVCDHDDPGRIVTGGMDPRGGKSPGSQGDWIDPQTPTVKTGGRVPAVPEAEGEMYRRAIERAMDQMCGSCPLKAARPRLPRVSRKDAQKLVDAGGSSDLVDAWDQYDRQHALWTEHLDAVCAELIPQMQEEGRRTKGDADPPTGGEQKEARRPISQGE
ncbi:hypothetical protein [Candidatus Poriferisocius sp.]|uniref:hypothetical protein n=1 Tax=Candidatus Poriferisocius sp. TaxID=3101276 RepID=UPI003B026682